MSTIAPRAISGAASSGVMSDSRMPKGPAHHSLFRFRSAPYSSSTSRTGRFFRTMLTGRPPKRADRRVDRLANLRVSFEQRAHAVRIAGAKRAAELFDRRFGERIDLAAHCGPTLEAVAACDDQLRVREFERVRCGRLRMEGFDALTRVRSGATSRREQVLRPLLLHLRGWDVTGEAVR